MKTRDIGFLKHYYMGYRAVALMKRLEYRWLVRIIESGLELEVYEDDLISNFNTDKVLWKNISLHSIQK